MSKSGGGGQYPSTFKSGGAVAPPPPPLPPLLLHHWPSTSELNVTDLHPLEVSTDTGSEDGPIPTVVLAATVTLIVANLGRPARKDREHYTKLNMNPLHIHMLLDKTLLILFLLPSI